MGAYCPQQSSAPKLCPIGSYQPLTGQTSNSSCLLCAENTYQYAEGQSTCYPCSSSSTSVIGSSSCTCIGKNRAFQPTDGYCICIPGYQFVDYNLILSSEKDGAYDCQPIVYSRCEATEVRQSDGSCVSAQAYCLAVCGVDGGEFGYSTGTCECKNVVPLIEICNATCRASAPSMTCDAEGNIVVFDPTSQLSQVINPTSLGMYGTFECTGGRDGKPVNKVFSMNTGGGSFAGQFGVGETVSKGVTTSRRRLYSEDVEAVSSNMFWHEDEEVLNPDIYIRTSIPRQKSDSDGSSFHQRITSYIDSSKHSSHSVSLTATGDTTTSPAVTNPIVCISAGDSIIFDVTNTRYPVYQKDSLLNTNDQFDYAAFRELAAIAGTSVVLSSFAFTFQAAGTYVFSLSDNPNSITVITAMADNVQCITDAAFVEFTSANLNKVGVLTNNSIVLSPDWNLIIGLLIGVVGIVLFMVGFMYYFRRKAWGHSNKITSQYRQKNKKLADPEGSKGGITSLIGGSSSKDKDKDKDNKKVLPINDEAEMKMKEDQELIQDLEASAAKDGIFDDDDMMIPELARSMQAHHDVIDRQLIDQKDLLSGLQETLIKEVDELKTMLKEAAIEQMSKVAQAMSGGTADGGKSSYLCTSV